MKNLINFMTLFFIFFNLGIIIYSMTVMIKYPLIGLNVQKENNQWIVEEIHENGWAATHPIKKGDVVQLIDGKNVEEHPTILLFNKIEKAESITFLNDGTNTYYDVTYEDTGEIALVSMYIPLAFSIIMIMLSLILYLSVKKDHASTILIYFLLSIGICYLGAFVSARGDLVGRFFTSLTLTSSVVLLLHFLRAYFLRYDLIFIRASTLKTVYIINFILFILFYFSQMQPKALDTAKLELTIFATLVVMLMVYLIRFYMLPKNAKGRPIVKILGLTVFLAFGPFIFFYAIPNIIWGEGLIITEWTAIFLLIIPISFVYLLLAEKLFDIEFLFNRLRYYSLLAIPVSVLIVLFIGLIPQIPLTSKELILTFLVIFMGIIFLLYTKEYLDFKLRHHLSSPKGNFGSSLHNFYQKAKRGMKVNRLIEDLQNEIRDVLGVRDTLYYEVYSKDKGDNWSIKNQGNMSSNHIQKIKSLHWDHYEIGTLIELRNGFGLIIGGSRYQKKVILFEMKALKVNLNMQEKIWLETLAYFSSVFLENFLLIEELVSEIEHYQDGDHYPHWLSRLLFALTEKERANLSIDLHDSVLQDQLQLFREIEQVAVVTTDAEMKNHLLNFQERLLDNIHLVRETCNELQPPFLSEAGVIQAIQNLIDQTNLRCSFILTSKLDKSIQWLDNDVELTLYRVVQELFNNAMEHSEATHVSLEIQRKAEIITLMYQDNGIGFNLEELQDSFKTMGLFGIQERVKSIGGSIQIITTDGEGMSVYVEIREVEYQ